MELVFSILEGACSVSFKMSQTRPSMLYIQRKNSIYRHCTLTRWNVGMLANIDVGNMKICVGNMKMCVGK